MKHTSCVHNPSDLDRSADVPVLVTGAAGFIGYHLADRLLDEGFDVVGVDNLNPYYDVELKKARLSRLNSRPGFEFTQVELAGREDVRELFFSGAFKLVVHLAAQAGVRYSQENPEAYIQSNLVGFFNILEGCRAAGVRHLVFASSSSVYGANTTMPYSVQQNVDHPLSLYAATKKADELMAHTYAALYGLPCTGLRFFTVYGPWGRPDMAYFLFTRKIMEKQPVEVYNYGKMKRDFTYIDDIVEGVFRIMKTPPGPDPDWDPRRPYPGTSFAPCRIYNIGNSTPVGLLEFISILEEELGRKAEKKLLPLQPGDVPETCADISRLVWETGFSPRVGIREGLKKFVNWYREYYNINEK
ncbi:MAG: NAD-dependent epimerase [Spirochaetota bacterium]